MNPYYFAEANCQFTPPSDLGESQCSSIFAHRGTIQGGSLDGCDVTVTAWLPTPEELELLKAGKPIFLSVIGGLPPHYLSTNFHSATHPA